jgi:superfamily I DNA/RNA helicase
VAQRYWLGHGDANFNAVQYGRLWPVCERDSKSPFEFLGLMTDADAKSGRVERLFSRHSTWITEKARLTSLSYSQSVDAIFPASEQDFDAIRDFIAGPLQAVDSLEALQNEIIQFVASPEVPDDLSAVKIMSLHKSKGLTFKVTIIAGVVEGLAPMVPERNDPDYDDILREQRRLFYVAMTRCKERLYISSFVNVGRGEAAQMNITLQGRNAIASRFLRELGQGAPRSVSGQNLLRDSILPL